MVRFNSDTIILAFWGNFHQDITNNLAPVISICTNTMIKSLLIVCETCWPNGKDIWLLIWSSGFNSLLGTFLFFSIISLFYPLLAIFRDFKPPKKGLLYQAIPMGPCAFNLNDKVLLPKLMVHMHFCTLPRNLYF